MGGRVEGAWGGGFGWSSGIESETPVADCRRSCARSFLHIMRYYSIA